MKIKTKWTFLRKHTHPNVVIPHLLVYPRTIMVDLSAQKVIFIFFRFCPIVKFMISLYKLNTRCAGPISFWKSLNFGKIFSWHRHSICHVVLTNNPQFGNISPAYCPHIPCRCGFRSTRFFGLLFLFQAAAPMYSCSLNVLKVHIYKCNPYQTECVKKKLGHFFEISEEVRTGCCLVGCPWWFYSLSFYCENF